MPKTPRILYIAMKEVRSISTKSQLHRESGIASSQDSHYFCPSDYCSNKVFIQDSYWSYELKNYNLMFVPRNRQVHFQGLLFSTSLGVIGISHKPQSKVSGLKERQAKCSGLVVLLQNPNSEHRSSLMQSRLLNYSGLYFLRQRSCVFRSFRRSRNRYYPFHPS